MTRLMKLTTACLALVGWFLPATASAEVQGVTDDTIKIGMQADLSGPLAVWGAPAANATRMRIDEVNAAGGVHGRQIDLIIDDTQYQVPQAVRATNKLVKRDKVFALHLGTGTAHNIASQQITAPQGIPNVMPMTAAKAGFYPENPLHWSYMISYEDQAIAGLKYFSETHGITSVCLQTHSTEFGAEITVGVEKAAEMFDLEIKFIGTHKPTESDFAGAATAIKNAGCDFVYLGTTVKDTIALYATLRALGFEGEMVASMVAYLPALAAAGEGAMNGLHVVAPFRFADFDNPDDYVADFVARYEERFGIAPTIQSQMGYIMTDTLIVALENAGRDLTPETLAAGFEAIKDREDPFGGPTVSFGPGKHYGTNEMVLVQVVDGKWQVLDANVEPAASH